MLTLTFCVALLGVSVSLRPPEDVTGINCSNLPKWSLPSLKGCSLGLNEIFPCRQNPSSSPQSEITAMVEGESQLTDGGNRRANALVK